MRYYELTESTLTKLMGKEPSAQNFARYLHRVKNINNNAQWHAIDQDELIDKMSNESNYYTSNVVLIKGQEHWAAIIPDVQSWQYYISQPDEGRGSKNWAKGYTNTPIDAVLEDIKDKIGDFEKMWISYQISDDESTELRMKRYNWRYRQQIKQGLVKPNDMAKFYHDIHNLDDYKKIRTIDQSVPNFSSRRANRGKPGSGSSIDRTRANHRRNPDIGDNDAAMEIARDTVDMYALVLFRAMIRAERQDKTEALSWIENELSSIKRGDYNTPLMVKRWARWIREINDLLADHRTQDEWRPVRENPRGPVSRKKLMGLAINQLLSIE